MADFVPFRVGQGFRPHVFDDQLEPVRQRADVRPVESSPPSSHRDLPQHGAIDRGPGLDRSMPAEVTVDAPDEPSGPSLEEIQQMLAEAEERGYARGIAEAEAAVAQIEGQALAELQRMQAVADGVDGYRETLAREVRDGMGDLLVKAVRRLTARTPELLDRVLQARCGEVAEHMVGAADVVVRVHPDDVKLAQRLLGERKGWVIQGDKRVRGGCVAESSTGSMDASLDAGLDALQAAVKAWREEARAQRTGTPPGAGGSASP